MKKSFLRILLSMGLIFSFVIGNFAPLQAASPAAEKDSQTDKIILKGGFEAKVVGEDKNGNTLYQADFGTPTYCDDLKTPIDTRWHEQPDGTFKSGANKFNSNVSAEEITIEKDSESIRWSPILRLAGADQGQDLKLKPENPQPEILAVDPMNENYQRNTLVWHYDQGIDRYCRLIEAECQEYYVINSPLANDLIIDPQAVQTPGFIWYKQATAYDDLGTGISLSEDSDKKITLKASNVKPATDKSQRPRYMAAENANEVQYPIVIDPNYSFGVSSSDGFITAYGTSYYTPWASTTGNQIGNTLPYGCLGQQKDGIYYFITRQFLYFNTSALADATIVSASLNLYGYVDQSDTDFDITIQNGQITYPHDPLELGDYNKANYSSNGGTFNTSGFTTAGYNNINLNATGLTWINKTGQTKLALRSSRDIAGTTVTGLEVAVYFSNEYGANYQPKLVVTYEAPPPPPTNVQASDGTSTENVQITWTASSGATGYSVYRNTDGGGSRNWVGNSDTESLNDTSSEPGTLYYYWVLAFNNCGEGDFSCCNTGWRKLSPPADVSATDGSFSDKIRITWDASTGATSYIVYRYESNVSGNATQIGTISASPYDDTSATGVDTYFYWVKSYCSWGDSEFSNQNVGWLATTHSNHYSDMWWVNWNGHESHVEWWYSQEGSINFFDELETAAEAWNDTPTIINMIEVDNEDDSVLRIYSNDYGDSGYYGRFIPFISWGNIELNEYYSQSPYNVSSDQWKIVAVHEMGHAHGLNHYYCSEEVMNDPVVNRGYYEPGVGDIAGINIKYLY